MKFEVKGTILPVLEATLDAGETVVSTHGDLGWMTPNVEMSQTTKMANGGGFMKSLKRVVGGGGLFVTRYTAQGAPGVVVFTTKLPGEIISLDLSSGREYMVHSSGFLCGTEGITASVAMQQKLTSGLFGGAGFFLQHLSGQGTAWLELGGEMFAYDLQPGQTLRVHPGHVAAFETSVNFQMTTVPGIANKFLSGNGLLLANLTGPGKVWLQSMSVATLAHAIEPYLPTESNRTTAGGLGGGIVGGIVSGALQ